jgi:hypothetical protein
LAAGLERVADTVRKQYDLLAESRSVVLDAIKEASAEATQQVQAGIDRLAEQAPEGFGPVFEAFAMVWLRKSVLSKACLWSATRSMASPKPMWWPSRMPSSRSSPSLLPRVSARLPDLSLHAKKAILGPRSPDCGLFCLFPAGAWA